MNDEIKYMKSLLMSDELINKIINYEIKSKTLNLNEKLNYIYNLLGFAGLTNEEISNVIYNNISILGFTKQELCKLGYVFENINLGDSLLTKNTVVRGLINYKRVFMRSLICNFSNRLLINQGTILTDPDSIVYGTKFYFGVSCYDLFKVSCSSDQELEQCLNNKLKFKDKFYSVDDYLKLQSTLFYERYLQNKNNLKQRGKQK